MSSAWDVTDDVACESEDPPEVGRRCNEVVMSPDGDTRIKTEYSGGDDSLEGLRWKRMLLSNVDYLEKEIELRELIDYFVGEEKLTSEHKVYILKGHPRKERFKRFFSIIKDVFENSTYYDLKNQIDKQHEDILRDMNDNGCGKEFNTSWMIRKLWKQIMDKAYGDVSFLIRHLYEKRKISSGQRDIIKSKDSHRKQMIELLMRIEKKGCDCLIEFFNGIKQIEPLADLHNEIEKEMANCEMSVNLSEGKIQLGEQPEMKDWQKAHLLMSYEHFNEAPYPEDIVDDLVESGVIELAHIKTIDKLNNYGWLVKHVLETDNEMCYNNLMKIINKYIKPQVCRQLENLAVMCEKDPDVLRKFHDIGNNCSDVQMTLRSIMNPKGGIVAVITPEGTEDSQFRRIAKMINKYGNFSAFSKGSMVLHIQFDSLLKLTEFWLAYLNGTLEKELLDILVTDSLKEQQGSSYLSIDIGFQLNDYVTAAYDLTLRPPTAVDNEANSGDGVQQSSTVLSDESSIIIEENILASGPPFVERTKLEENPISEMNYYRILEEKEEEIKTLKELFQNEMNQTDKIIEAKNEEIKELKEKHQSEVKHYEKIIEENEKEIQSLRYGSQKEMEYRYEKMTVSEHETLGLSKVASRDLIVKQTHSLEMEKKKGIVGLVLYKGHLLVTHRDDNSLYVYKSARFPASSHEVPGLRRPIHMVGLTDGKNDYLVISDRNGLQWVTLLMEEGDVNLGPCRTIKQESTSYGMCVTSFGQVMVCGPGTDQLYKYSSDGQCLGHIRLSPEVRPWCITALSAGDGYVIGDISQITWIREDGTTSHGVQGEVRPGIYLDGPQHMIHDNKGNILVADCGGQQVLVFDQHGHCTGQLLSGQDGHCPEQPLPDNQDGILRPSRLLLDQQTDTLYVACTDPTRVMIYSYSPLLATLDTTSDTYAQSKLGESVKTK